MRLYLHLQVWSMWPSSQPTSSSYFLSHSVWFSIIGNDWILVILSQACWKRDSWWTGSRYHVDPGLLQSFYTMWRLRMKLTWRRRELGAQEKLRLFRSQNLEKLKSWLLLEFSRLTWKNVFKRQFGLTFCLLKSKESCLIHLYFLFILFP